MCVGGARTVEHPCVWVEPAVGYASACASAQLCRQAEPRARAAHGCRSCRMRTRADARRARTRMHRLHHGLHALTTAIWSKFSYDLARRDNNGSGGSNMKQ